MTDSDEIKQFLETQMKILPPKEFLDLLFQRLEENPSKEMRGLLRPYLCAYAEVNRNRVANYLAQFLSDPDPIEREIVIRELFTFPLEPEDDAYKILCEFLGEEPTKENRDRILSQRLSQMLGGNQ
jgi:hypothetical protein